MEPLSRILEPVSVRHLDEESPRERERDGRTAVGGCERDGDRVIQRERERDGRSVTGGCERDGDRVIRRQMSSQLVRGGSAARDPGVCGPRVWDLHCQRVRDGMLRGKTFIT